MYDVQYMDYSMMKEMRWTWRELVDTPLHVILSISFIYSRKAAYDKLQALKGEKEKK